MHAVRLASLDGNHELLLTEAQLQALISYMIDLEVVNKRIDLADISKWERRVLRRSSHSSLSDLDPLSAEYNTYFDQWRKHSQRDRSLEEPEVPSFKFTDRNYWIVTGEECKRIHYALEVKLAKKREKILPRMENPAAASCCARSGIFFISNRSLAVVTKWFLLTSNCTRFEAATSSLLIFDSGTTFINRYWHWIFGTIPPLHESEEFDPSKTLSFRAPWQI